MIYADGTDTCDERDAADLTASRKDSEAWEAVRLECKAEEEAKLQAHE